MEKPLDFVLKLSLQEMALKAVIDFWSEPDILDCMENFFILSHGFGDQRTWKETVEDWVKEKVGGLVIPASLKKRMNLVVKPIGLQIRRWEVFIEECLDRYAWSFLDLQVLKQLCWTSVGTIDYRKTAEKLVSLQTLTAEQRFKIACGHFMIDYLPNIWKELSREYKRGFNESIFGDLDRLLEQKHRLFEIYCVFNLKGEEYKFFEIFDYSYMLKLAVLTGNKAATEYFFTKLSYEERNLFILLEFQSVNKEICYKSSHCYTREKCKEPDCYLLSQMTAEQQMQVIRDNPGSLFHTLLQWPRQDLFLDKSDLIWSFTPEGGPYNELVFQVEKKIMYGDHCFPELLQEFFQLSPSAFRKQFIDAQIDSGGSLFFTLFWNKDKETIKVIFRNTENEDRVRFMSSYSVYSRFTWNLKSEKHLFKLCVREALPYKEDRYNLELLYETYQVMYGFEFKGSVWQEIFEFCDKTNRTGVKKRKLKNKDETNRTGVQKRKLNNETQIKAKKKEVEKKDKTNKTSVKKRKLVDETLSKFKNIAVKKKKYKTKTMALQKTKSDNETLTKAKKIPLKKTVDKTNRNSVKKRKLNNENQTKAKKIVVGKKDKTNKTGVQKRKLDDETLTKTKKISLKKTMDKTNRTFLQKKKSNNVAITKTAVKKKMDKTNAKTTVMKETTRFVKKN